MRIEKVNVTEENLVSMMKDETIYAIRKNHGLFCQKYRMMAIGDCDFNDIMSGELTFVRITEEEGES